MPKPNDVPEKLKPYLFHRVDLNYEGSGEPRGTCPFCGGDKFFVGRDNGLFSCKVGSCGASGNAYTFIRKLYQASLDSSQDAGYEEVAEDRKIPVEEIKEWGLCRSIIDQEWILPAYGPKGEVSNLYRWSLMKGKRRFLATTTFNAYLFGYQFWDQAKPDVYLAEGPWDGMALRYDLGSGREVGGRLIRTLDKSLTLLARTNVLAVPGCETFREEWVSIFAGKNVTLLYDNDYPRTVKTGTNPPAGTAGMKTAARKLRKVAKSISYLHWGDEGYDAELPDSFDVRDYLTQEDAETTTIAAE